MLCRICVVQIQPRKHVLDLAGHTAPTWQHELDHTDQKNYLTCLADLEDELYDLYDLSEVLSSLPLNVRLSSIQGEQVNRWENGGYLLLFLSSSFLTMGALSRPISVANAKYKSSSHCSDRRPCNERAFSIRHSFHTLEVNRPSAATIV